MKNAAFGLAMVVLPLPDADEKLLGLGDASLLYNGMSAP